jgi:hypothetical protein
LNGSRLFRIVMLVLAVGLIVWIARNTYWDDVGIPMPLQGEAATNPYYAAQQFTKELGIESSWEKVFTRVPTSDALFLSSWHWTLIEGRRQRLEDWVKNGGRLIVDRSLGGEEAFAEWSGIEHHLGKLSDNDDEATDEESTDESASSDDDASADDESELGGDDGESDGEETTTPSMLRKNVRPCRRIHDLEEKTYELCGARDSSYLTTDRRIDWALRGDDGGIQVVRVKIGKGSVTVINDVPFRFRDFLLGDHPTLLVSTGQLRHGDTVHFLSEEEQPSLISLMWTYGWPVVVLSLALIGLALWRNSVRFGPLAAEPELARRSLAEQIRGTGQFAVRFGGGKALHAAAVRALDEAARRRLPAYPRLSAVERVAAIAKLAGIDAETLGPAIHHSGPRRQYELRQAIALIESARRRLQQAPH